MREEGGEGGEEQLMVSRHSIKFTLVYKYTTSEISLSNHERGGVSTNTDLWLRLSATSGRVEKRGRFRGDTRGLGGGLGNLGTRDNIMVPWCARVLH